MQTPQIISFHGRPGWDPEIQFRRLSTSPIRNPLNLKQVGVACPQRVRLGHFIIQPEAAGNSKDSRVTSPFRRGGPVRAGGPSRHPRPQGNDQFDPQRSRVVRIATSSPYVVLADLGWHCRTGASLSPNQRAERKQKEQEDEDRTPQPKSKQGGPRPQGDARGMIRGLPPDRRTLTEQPHTGPSTQRRTLEAGTGSRGMRSYDLGEAGTGGETETQGHVQCKPPF